MPVIHRDILKNCDVVRGFGLASGISALLLNKSFVVNWAYDYASFVKVEKKSLYLPLYFLLERLVFLKATKVFIATKSKFKSLSGEKYIYLPNGVDTNLFAPRNKKNKGLLFIGRMENQKNLPLMLHAVSLLPEEDRSLTIIGRGSLNKDLLSLADRLKVHLIIKDPVENTKLPELMSRFSIFLMTSWHEGSPKVLLEAMATGLVPVVTSFPTSKDIIDDGKDGFIVPFNATDLAEKIELLLNNSEVYQQISKAAIKKIHTEFNFSMLIKKEINTLQMTS